MLKAAFWWRIWLAHLFHRNVSIANLSSVQGEHAVKNMSMSEHEKDFAAVKTDTSQSAAVQAYTCLGAEPRLDSSISKALSGL